MSLTDRRQPRLGLWFALCPICERERAIVWRPATRRYRTRRHSPCGVVDLPADVPIRPL